MNDEDAKNFNFFVCLMIHATLHNVINDVINGICKKIQLQLL